MDDDSPWIGNKVVLKLLQVNIEGAVKPQGCRHRRHYLWGAVFQVLTFDPHLRDDAIEIGVSWPVHLEAPLADLVDGLQDENHGRP